MLCGCVQEDDDPTPHVENEETSTTSYVVAPSTTNGIASTTSYGLAPRTSNDIASTTSYLVAPSTTNDVATTTGIDNYRLLEKLGKLPSLIKSTNHRLLRSPPFSVAT